VRTRLNNLQDYNGKRIMLEQAREAHRACLMQAEAFIDRMFNCGKDSHGSWVHVNQELKGMSRNANSLPRNLTTAEPTGAIFDNVLEAFERLGALDVATKTICKNVDRVILQPLISHRLNKDAISVSVDNGRLEMSHVPGEKDVWNVLDNLFLALEYLQTNLPKSIEGSVASAILPDLVSTLVANWLSLCVPLELADIAELEALQTRVSNLAKELSTSGWPGSQGLLDWVELAPRMWLARRRVASLDRVRTALSLERGPTREVERTERQVVSNQDAVFATEVEGNDWNTSWDDDNETSVQPPAALHEEDDVSAWDFDADEEVDQHRTPGQAAAVSDGQDEESAEAWGWDEDSQEKARDMTSSTSNPSQQKIPRNGTNGDVPQGREVTLKESYTITDIPDSILDIISKDVLEATEVKDSKYSALRSVSPSSGLLALPTFVLAMFRATAPSHYTAKLSNGNMHLYNDSMYIAEKLRDASSAPELAKIRSDCDSLEKFAKTAYGREMDVQRTLLADLLDGAQGFTSCTQFPYSKQCEDAVSSVVDRIRQVYKEWSPILSSSALLQSVGSLLSKVIDKTVQDIEDMEDITEPESQRLASFCTQISELGDLFIQADQPRSGVEAVPLTTVYVSNWLRFQYMANILESSLVDIKYLWMEGELSLEFSAEEVVDLIRALFAESPNRRNAIADIRRSKSRQSR
jgi:centromere/kinetochore protein ZW10